MPSNKGKCENHSSLPDDCKRNNRIYPKIQIIMIKQNVKFATLDYTMTPLRSCNIVDIFSTSNAF